VVPLSLVIIFVLLSCHLRPRPLGPADPLNVPFALVGGIAALWLRGLT
jgi:heavy metal efflux system protein